MSIIPLIAAGGRGTRMLPSTSFCNKHLLPVGYGRLMIDFPLRTMAELGFKTINLVTGCEHAGQVSEYVRDGKRHGFDRVNYEIQDKAGGIAEVISKIDHLEHSLEDFRGVLLILGDNYFSENQAEAMTHIISKLDRAAGFQFDLRDLERAKSFGQMFFDEKGEPSVILEKPKKPQHSSVLVGLYYFPIDVFEKLKTLTPSLRGELEVTALMNMYLEEKRLDIYDVKGNWADLGEWESWMGFIKQYLDNKDA